MIRARVRVYFEDRGYGFLSPLDDGDDVFVHVSECPGQQHLQRGQLVDIEYEYEERGARAYHVELVETEAG
jgi:CspA family cold shock protein